MKKITTVLALATFLGATSANATTSADQMETRFTQEALVHQTMAQQTLAPVNDPVALTSHRAGLAGLAYALGVASIDLALMGFFYGVYVPYFAPQEPAYDFN